MGQAQSIDSGGGRVSKKSKNSKTTKKSVKKASPPSPVVKSKKSGKSKKVEVESEAESEGPSECPSSFLGDESDADEPEDSGHGTLTGKPTTFTPGMFCAFGVHSVDISVTVGKAYLDRYSLAPGSKVDFDQNQHKDLISEVKNWFPFEHKPSGSALFTSRILNWIVREPEVDVVTVGGTVGSDDNGGLIESKMGEFGLKALLKKNSIANTAASISLSCDGAEGHPTTVTKSSVAGSAFKLGDYNETNTPEMLEKAKIIYLTGYFIASSPEASLEICRYAAEKGKIVALSLSATYICQFHKATVLQLLQYVDYLFGNEDQVLTFAREMNMKDSDNIEICNQTLARLPKINSSRRRMVITQNGENSCLVAQGYNKIRLFIGTSSEQTPSLDGTGIFDAFVGGFLSQIIQGLPLEEAIEIGYRSCSSMNGVNSNSLPEVTCDFGKIEIEAEVDEDEEDGEEDGDDDEGEEDEGEENEDDDEGSEDEEESEDGDDENDDEEDEDEENEDDEDEESEDEEEEDSEKEDSDEDGDEEESENDESDEKSEEESEKEESDEESEEEDEEEESDEEDDSDKESESE